MVVMQILMLWKAAFSAVRVVYQVFFKRPMRPINQAVFRTPSRKAKQLFTWFILPTRMYGTSTYLQSSPLGKRWRTSKFLHLSEQVFHWCVFSNGFSYSRSSLRFCLRPPPSRACLRALMCAPGCPPECRRRWSSPEPGAPRFWARAVQQ